MRLEGVTDLARSRGDDAETAATQLEAHFLRRMLSEMRPQDSEGMFGGGMAGGMFREMLDEALADAMADAGGIGLAPMISDELDRLGGGKGAMMTSMPPAADGYRAAATRATAAYRASGPLAVMPVDGRQTSDFGPRVDPMKGGHGYHTGLDIAAPMGTAVHASGDGVVVRAGTAGGYGNMVVIDHGGGVETRYAHLSEMAVQVGDRVAAGAVVGGVGSTGRSTGPHLHFEVRRDGSAVDPQKELGTLKDAETRPSR